LPSIILSLVLLAVRLIIVPVVSAGNKGLLANTGILGTMLPRGLSAAVVAEIVASSAIPDARLYPEIVIVVIATTVIISAVGIPVFAQKSLAKNREAMEEAGRPDSS